MTEADKHSQQKLTMQDKLILEKVRIIYLEALRGKTAIGKKNAIQKLKRINTDNSIIEQEISDKIGQLTEELKVLKAEEEEEQQQRATDHFDRIKKKRRPKPDKKAFTGPPIKTDLQKEIVNYLKEHGPVPRAILVAELDRPRTTIYDNLNKLQNRKVVEKFSKNNGKRGRPKVYWQIRGVN
jgi:uncharacterized membrane protein